MNWWQMLLSTIATGIIVGFVVWKLKRRDTRRDIGSSLKSEILSLKSHIENLTQENLALTKENLKHKTLPDGYIVDTEFGYITTSQGAKICQKCWHVRNEEVLLTDLKYGWKCRVCTEYYANPNWRSDLPREANNDYDVLN